MLFLQLHCSDSYLLREACEDYHANHQPQILVSDSIEALLRAKRLLEDEAKQTNWVRKKRGWLCQYCAKQEVAHNV